MKRTLIYFLSAVALMSCGKVENKDNTATTPENAKYKIVVQFADSTLDGNPAYLTNYDTGDTISITNIDKAVATIEGTAERSFYARLVVDGKRLGFIVENGDITIDWEKRQVTGTPLNEALNKFHESMDEIENQYDDIKSQLTAGKITQEESDAREAEIDNQIAEAFHKVYADNKENGIGPWAYYNYLMCKQYNLAQLDSALDTAPEFYKDMKRFNKAIEDAKRSDMTAEGKPMTDFKVACDDGVTRALSQFVGKGEFTLVDFWASWCGPCREEIGNLKQLYKKYNGKGMSFLGVAVWDAPADTRKAIDELQIPWNVIVGNAKLEEPTALYGIMGIPHIIIFGPDGTILSRGLQGDKLVKKVEELMDAKSE